ncbi:pectinesterase/pectinesterase inhibitor 28 [Canna indica]|uniref:Pectinesterase n=1 Tax=Canna indica TaxID=4628 RepID=A0AAQ3L0S5_9LILI|nr:pectinesterase/pectinesterase inhibitor 28 [Canna indica]
MGSKKVAIIGVSAVLLVAIVATVAVTITSSHSEAASSSSHQLSASAKNIQDFCQPTDYKQTCVQTLSAAAGNKTNLEDLVNLAFNVTIAHIDDAFKHSTVLSKAAKDPRTSEALRNCRELLDYAIDDLKNSLDRIGDFSIAKLDKLLGDLKVWLSATVTYQETCLDGFEGANTDSAESMRKALNVSSKLTSNILAIISSFGETIADLNLSFGRKLLSMEFPSWIAPGQRRLLRLRLANLKPHITVAKDGSGDVRTISEAVNRIPKKSKSTFIIHIKEGVYRENIHVNKSFINVMMIGDGPTKTKITGSLNYIDGTPTFKTATLAVVGDGFIGKDLWIENSAGPKKHQAVALRVQSDKSVFYNCRFDGYQDTLYAHTKRQFYRECTISGTIDFIFGDAASVFQNCLILARKPLDNQKNIVTAQGRKDRRQPSAIVLHNCTIAADPAFFPYRKKLPTFLGRPWKEYSRALIMQSHLDDLIDPKGWLPWVGEFGLRTCFYAEVNNRGPGAGKSERVKWRGVKKINNAHASNKYTVDRIIQGSAWLPKTGVPFIPGLLPEGSL